MTSLIRLHHAHITIPKGAEEAGRAFYCGVLGLTEIEKPDSLKARGGLWLELAGQQIHIGIQDGVDRRALKSHLAFQVADVNFWLEKLRGVDGVEIGESVPIPGYERFEFRDPFGNRLEIIGEAK